MDFHSIRERLLALASEVSEIQSTVYTTVPFVCNDRTFIMVSFFDMESYQMNFALLDERGQEIRQLPDVPHAAVLEYASFIHTVQQWQNEGTEFPYPDHTGQTSLQDTIARTSNTEQPTQDSRISGADVELDLSSLVRTFGSNGAVS